MKMGIYQIRCLENNKIYVGSSVNIPSRWSHHKFLLRKNKHNSIHLQRSYNKYGIDSFVIEILENVQDESKLIEREQFYFDKLKPFGDKGYNISPIAGRTKGVKRTAEQIEKTARHHRGRKFSDERKLQISLMARGRKHTPEAKEKMRAARLKNNHQVGRPLTEKQYQALCTKKGSDHPFYGRNHSEETKRKISLLNSREVICLDKNGMEIKRFLTAEDAAKDFGLKSADCIRRSANSDFKMSCGYRWKWA